MKSVTRLAALMLLPLALLLVMSPALTPTANADELYGRIRGVVADSTGAVLPGAQLKLTNVGMGTSQELT